MGKSEVVAVRGQGASHCDVSAGNVLIQIKEKVVDGQLVQKRIGLLTDWELSNRTTASADPRRPHRIVSGSCPNTLSNTNM